MALRLSAERAALPMPEEQAETVAALPSLSALTSPTLIRVPDLPEVESDDDEREELFDAPQGDDFYADAFEVIE